MFAKTAVFFCLMTAVVSANLLDDILKECGEDVKCAEKTFIKSVDGVDSEADLKVLGEFVRLRRVADGTGVARADGEGVLERITRFFDGREMSIKLPTSMEEARKVFEEARSSKIKKFVVPFIVLLIIKKSIEIPIVLALLSLVAFKGLGVGLISLVLSGATALKSLLEHHSTSKVSYEVVPQLSSSHWSRSGSVDYPNFMGGYHTISQY